MKYKVTAKDTQGDGGTQFKVKEFANSAAIQAYKNKLKSSGWELDSIEPYSEPSKDYGTEQSIEVDLPSALDPLQGVVSQARENKLVRNYNSQQSMETPEVEDIKEKEYIRNQETSPFAQGALQGATFGFSDEIGGFVDDETKEYMRAKQTVAKEQNPIQYGVGEWLGSIPSGLGVGKAIGAGAKALIPVVAKSATMAGQLGRIASNPGMTSALAEGALSGAGQADDGARAKGAVAGAGMSLAGAFLGQSLAKKVGAKAVDNTDEFLKSVDDIVRAKKSGADKAVSQVAPDIAQSPAITPDLPQTPAQLAVRREFDTVSPELAREPMIQNMTSAKFTNSLDEALLRGGRDQNERLIYGAVAKDVDQEAKENALKYLEAKAAQEAIRSGIEPIQKKIVNNIVTQPDLPAATFGSFNQQARAALNQIPIAAKGGQYAGAGVMSSNIVSGDSLEQAAEESQFGAQIADKLLSPKEERDRLEQEAMQQALQTILQYERKRGMR
jgi:hypothetical protein